MFGGFIMDLGTGEKPTAVETIDRVLSEQQQAIEQMQDRTGYAMVDVETVRTR
jgi:hypothetical protein